MRTLHNQIVKKLKSAKTVKTFKNGKLEWYDFSTHAEVEPEKELPLSSAILLKMAEYSRPKMLRPDAIVTLNGVSYVLEVTHKHKDSAQKIAYYNEANLGVIRINISKQKSVSEWEDSAVFDFLANSNSITIEPAKKIKIYNLFEDQKETIVDSVLEADTNPDGYFVLGIEGKEPIKMYKQSFGSGDCCFEDVFDKKYDPEKTFLENMNVV